MEAKALYAVISVLAAGLAIAISTLGPGIGQGLATKSAVEAVARQPEASGKIMILLLLGLAMMEALTLYAFVIALLILFLKPFIGVL